MDVKSASGTIGVVGTGVIGAGWAAYFLAKGFDVAASDPAEGAETRLRSIVSVGDIDTVVADGLGLRWALLGPFVNLHLSGGAGGISHVLEHLGPSLEAWWRDLGDVSLNDSLNGLIVSGLDSELAGVDLGDIVARRDQQLSGLLKLKDVSACAATTS
jgi:3-hydroxyacyl-CoA dehydrogenase